jgi:hypothetical protein
LLHTITPQFHLPTRALQDLFNWSPEYDRGGAEYEKAATIYKNFKEWAKAIYAYTKCAEANDKASLPTKVASALDFKAGCLRDAGQVHVLRGWCYAHCMGSISALFADCRSCSMLQRSKRRIHEKAGDIAVLFCPTRFLI